MGTQYNNKLDVRGHDTMEIYPLRCFHVGEDPERVQYKLALNCTLETEFRRCFVDSPSGMFSYVLAKRKSLELGKFDMDMLLKQMYDMGFRYK